MHPAVTRAAPWANGGSIPSLRTVHTPEVPMAERWSPKPEATGSIPVRRADDDRDPTTVIRRRGRAERRGAATSVDAGSIPAVVFILLDGGCSSTG